MDKKIAIAFLFLLFFATYLRWTDPNVLVGADSYYHYRKSDEIVRNEIADTDHLRNPPEGIGYRKNFYHYFTAYTYKFIPFISLEKYMIYLPLVFSLLSVLVAYKIGRIFSTYTGIFAGFFVATTPMLVERTHKGFADTDSLVLLFILLLIYLYTKFFATKNILYLVFLGLTLFFFQTFWSGYWLFVYVFLGSLFFYAICESRKNITSLIYFLIPSVIYILPATLYRSSTLLFLLRLYRHNLNPVEIQKTIDVSQTVGELLPVRTSMLLPALGAVLPLGLAGLCLLLYLTYKWREFAPFSMMMALLLVLSVITLQGGYRFLFLFAIPLLLLSVICLGVVFQNFWKIQYKVGGIMVIIIILSFCMFHATIYEKRSMPYPDDDWREALSWIDENLEENAVIVAWWDHGYWIEALGKRAAYVDNGHRPDLKIMRYAEMLTSTDTAMLHELGLENCYILLSERELFNFEMISYFVEERLEYMVRFPRKTESYHDFSTFYDEHLIFENDGTITIGSEDNFIPFNGYVYSPKEYRVVYADEPLPSRIFVVKPELAESIFTEMYIYDAENLPDITLIKEFKKVKLFKVLTECEDNE